MMTMVKVLVTVGYHCGVLGVRMMMMIDVDLLTLVDDSDFVPRQILPLPTP